MTAGHSLAFVLRVADVLARGLSSGRRQRCRAMLDEGRGFTTDLRSLYIPWPLPDGLEPDALAPRIALQCAPTKELLAPLALAHLNARERAALQLIEGAHALLWAATFWPGLTQNLRALAPDVPLAATLATRGDELLEQALLLARGRAPLQVPAVFGHLPLVRTAHIDLAARRAQLESRLPWSMKQRLERLNNWSVAIGGEGDSGASARRSAPLDEESEERTLAQRKARLGTPYPEWDVFHGRYREDHVTVFETRVTAPTPAPSGPVDPRLAAWFEQPLERRWQQRLEDGSDLDVEALVDMRIDELSGSPHTDRLYRERLPAARDVACALLIDRSGSLSKADLLTHEVACANALTAAMTRAGERHGVFAFWSDGRDHVAFEVLRDFDDVRPLQLQAAQLRPRGYTRMGAALRHATARLQREPARRRVLLVLGDGVPCDEGYEGGFAAADVAKAVEEADKLGVTTAFIALGRPADDALAEALPHHLTRIDNMANLAPLLGTLHARLVS